MMTWVIAAVLVMALCVVGGMITGTATWVSVTIGAALGYAAHLYQQEEREFEESCRKDRDADEKLQQEMLQRARQYDLEERRHQELLDAIRERKTKARVDAVVEQMDRDAKGRG